MPLPQFLHFLHMFLLSLPQARLLNTAENSSIKLNVTHKVMHFFASNYRSSCICQTGHRLPFVQTSPLDKADHDYLPSLNAAMCSQQLCPINAVGCLQWSQFPQLPHSSLAFSHVEWPLCYQSHGLTHDCSLLACSYCGHCGLLAIQRETAADDCLHLINAVICM